VRTVSQEEDCVPGSIVFRWYDRAQADEVYSTWTAAQLQARLEADKRKETGQPPLGRPGAATTESLERLLADWRAQGYAEMHISEIPAGHASDRLLRYELICDACSQAEWRAKDAFLLRHMSGLRGDGGEGMGSAVSLATAELEAQYAASREGRFRWREWPALTEALAGLEWNRWVERFHASYKADKAIRRAGVERALRDNYEAFEELGRLLQEGDQQGWAVVVYDANDERLPFPAPPILQEAVRQTEAEVAKARRAAEATLARRRRFWRIVVPIVLLILFLMLSFLFTRSLIGTLIGTALIVLIIGIVVYFIVRPQARADRR
jgi:hypothetical protein